ncbi:MAG: type I 3-dehydroquinate dehydratase [Fibromonadaceae bacterium]|jgi:3-dehydroquinate dehydratase-1|nr:type I 3-dehydroquinate dehydratase [Fibromonadaceae bacterium]
MPNTTKNQFVAGLISNEVLRYAERNPLGAEAAAIKKCSILEIRYDLFENESEWSTLSQRALDLSPKALRLGTIRLEKDGGAFKNERAAERMPLFVGKALDWIDLERGVFSGTENLDTKIICSWHLFDRVPSEQELNKFAEECLDLKAHGCKVAAMAHSKNEADALYDFTKKYEKYFELFSAFAMGEQGKESRLRSLREGANLIYGSIKGALAPGQLSIDEIFECLTSKNQ